MKFSNFKENPWLAGWQASTLIKFDTTLSKSSKLPPWLAEKKKIALTFSLSHGYHNTCTSWHTHACLSKLSATVWGNATTTGLVKTTLSKRQCR